MGRQGGFVVNVRPLRGKGGCDRRVDSWSRAIGVYVLPSGLTRTNVVRLSRLWFMDWATVLLEVGRKSYSR